MKKPTIERNSSAAILDRARPALRTVSFVVASTLTLMLSMAGRPALAQEADGIPNTSMALPSLYMENTFLKFVLSAYGKTEAEKLRILTDAENAISRYVSQPRPLHRIETEEDFERIKELYFPPFQSLSDEVEYHRTHQPPGFFMVVPANDEIASKIEKYWQEQQERLGALSKVESAVSSAFEPITLRKYIFKLLDNPKAVKLVLDTVPVQQRLALMNRLLQSVSGSIRQIETTGATIVESKVVKHANPAMQRFFELAIGEYFKNLDISTKLDIIAAFLDQPSRKSAQEKFEIMVMSSGPQFQKLFQVYARQEGFGEELKNVFKKLESSVRPAPWRLIKKAIDAEGAPFEWVTIDRKPLGVGTMAQVHRALIRLKTGETKKVVVRVMKPGIADTLAKDGTVLRKLAPLVDADPLLTSLKFPHITPFVNEIIAMTEAELNVQATVDAQKHASTIYNREVAVNNKSFKGTIVFHVPGLFEASRPGGTIMVQEYVPGTSFEKFEQENPGLARTTVEEIAKLWLENALIGEGFFHADLHQGNLRVDHTGQSVKVNILDYGMTGQVESRLQSRILALSAVLGARRADLIAKGLWEIAEASRSRDANSASDAPAISAEPKITLAELTKKIEAELARPQSISHELGDWVGLAANAGVKFPKEFTSLNRGLALIKQMLQNQQSTLTVDEITKGLLLRSPMKLKSMFGSMDSVSTKDWLQVFGSQMLPSALKPKSCQIVLKGP